LGEKVIIDIDEMEADHITPWHEGGKTVSENCQMLCKDDIGGNRGSRGEFRVVFVYFGMAFTPLTYK
jgi:5-methylcytosine-specific restriction endonuclease McrA